MLKKVLWIFAIFLINTNISFADDNNKAITQITIQYQRFAERILSYRTKAHNLFIDIKDKEPLSGKDLDRIHHMILNHLNTKDVIQKFIDDYKDLANEDVSEVQKLYMQKVMISLSAMLLRYDNYLVSYKDYQDDDKLRQLLNEEDKAYDIPKDVLKNIKKVYDSRANRDDVKDMISFYKEHIDDFEDIKDDPFEYLQMLIEQSPSYKNGFDDGLKGSVSYQLTNVKTSATDLNHQIIGKSTYQISKVFGNSAGMVETRKGKLYNKKDVAKHIKSIVKAGDILVEKTPFRLTDKLIPGYWGHAAVYIGTEDELKKLGIWDNPVVQRYHKDITDGKVIAEALRDDVQLNTVEHFLNIDDLVILQDVTENDEDRAYRIVLVLRQIGKEYDFNFDIETTKELFCSELVYMSSFNIDWDTEESAGVHTISPDDVARKSIEDDTMLEIHILYHDGEEIKENKKAYMKKLMED